MSSMAYIDKESAKKLVSKHKSLFSSLASGSEDALRGKVEKMVNQTYITMLFLSCGFIGLVWWLLMSWNLLYADFFLLLVVLFKTKRLLDRDFSGMDDNIVEAVKELRAAEASDEEKNSDKKD